MQLQDTTFFNEWDIVEDDIEYLIKQNPSLRGMIFGYVAEKKFHEKYLLDSRITEVHKDRDHDRRKKGDRRIVYKGITLSIEMKSVQTNSKKPNKDTWKGTAQVDASDCRLITLPDNSQLKTSALLRGQFDILGINCHVFENEWNFAFALNSELPQNKTKKYTEYQRSCLLPGSIPITWPLEQPFTEDLFEALDRAIELK